MSADNYVVIRRAPEDPNRFSFAMGFASADDDEIPEVREHYPRYDSVEAAIRGAGEYFPVIEYGISVADECYQPAPGKTRVWVDTLSGTWGNAEYIRFVDVDPDILEGWDQMSDSAIADLARQTGFRPQ